MADAAPPMGQMVLIALSAAGFAAAGACAAAGLWRHRPAGPDPRGANSRGLLRRATTAALAGSVALAGGVLVRHATYRPGGQRWAPLADNFEALVWLGFLLGAFVLYVQIRRPVRALVAAVAPAVTICLVAAVGVGRVMPHAYDVGSLWSLVHRIGTFGGAAVLSVAAFSGLLYLVASNRLKHKIGFDRAPDEEPPLGSLERLEGWTHLSVTIGFALLTVGLVTGLTRIDDRGTALADVMSPKVLPAVLAWLVYAVALHAPVTPVLRGRKTAWLSVAGFACLVVAVVGTQLIVAPAVSAGPGHVTGEEVSL